MSTFGGPEAAQITRTPYETLRSWHRGCFFSPSIRQPSGRGSRVAYSVNDLFMIRIFRALREKGVSLQRLRAIAPQIRRMKHMDRSLPDAVLLVTCDRAHLLRTHDQLLAAVVRETNVACVIEKKTQATENNNTLVFLVLISLGLLIINILE